MDDYYTGYLWANKALMKLTVFEIREQIELDRVDGNYVEFNNGAERALTDFENGGI